MLKAKEIDGRLLEVYKESSPRNRTVEFWAGERGRTRLEDDPREGRPKTATTPEIIEQVHNIVSEDLSLTKHEIANAIGISDERVRVLRILHGEFHMKKLFGKLVPHTITLQQKQDRKKMFSIIWSVLSGIKPISCVVL